MDFIKYQHVERFGRDEVDGIEEGLCYVFPKIDGTNGQVWSEDGTICCGSRNRKLSLENDNQGFMREIVTTDTYSNLRKLLIDMPNLRIYGEWLVPHTLKTYRKTAWRQFYVFDVMELREGAEEESYMPYEVYKEILDVYGVEYIAPLATIKNPTEESLLRIAKENHYLIEDGNGVGEGIVIKNYAFENKFHRTTWAKVVLSEFKDKHRIEMSAPEIVAQKLVEEEIVKEFCTEEFIHKTYDKIRVANDGFNNKNIPELLGRVWYDFINEETVNFLKKYKNPKIDFKRMQRFLVQKVKTEIKF